MMNFAIVESLQRDYIENAGRIDREIKKNFIINIYRFKYISLPITYCLEAFYLHYMTITF